MSATLRKCYFVVYIVGGQPPSNKNKEAIMKNLKIMALAALAVMVTSSFAEQFVKSKLGDIEISSLKDGGSVVCTAGFHDELKIIRNADTKVLVQGKCGRGWVDKDLVEYVAAGPGDKSMVFDSLEIWGHTDNPGLIGLIYDNINDVEDVKIDRDFKEYLTYTMDRESIESKNGEN